MRKVAKVLVMVCLVVFSATVAMAADGRGYAGFNAGAFIPTDSKVTDSIGDTADIEYNTGFGISGFGGYEFGSGLRLEGELTYKQAEMSKFKYNGLSADISSDAALFGVLANCYFDFKNSTPVTPYIGGGLGFATLYVGEGTASNGNRIWNDDNDTVFAYQIGGGIGFDVSKKVTIDVGYRYFGTSEAKFDLLKAEFASHNVVAGARFKF